MGDSGKLMYLKRKTTIPKISPQIHAKYYNLEKQGILCTHENPRVWCIHYQPYKPRKLIIKVACLCLCRYTVEMV